jgi:hypothetical protein
VRPHLTPLDRVHHLRTQQAVRETWIVNGYCPSGHRGQQKNRHRQHRLRQILAKQPRIRFSIEGQDAGGPFPPSRIDEVVASAQQLVQVNCKLRARPVLLRRCQIGRRLPVKEAQFLQLGVVQPAESVLRAADQLLQPVPVRLTLLDPLDGNHVPSAVSAA